MAFKCGHALSGLPILLNGGLFGRVGPMPLLMPSSYHSDLLPIIQSVLPTLCWRFELGTNLGHVHRGTPRGAPGAEKIREI